MKEYMREYREYDIAPVLVFTYNRLDHTKMTLEALNNSPLANSTDLFIFCDNYRDEKSKEKVEKVREFVDGFSNSAKFKKINVIKANTNKGLAKSIIEGVTQIISLYHKVIVVEDDLLTDCNFLNYMNNALSYYENIDKVWAISGYTFPLQALDNYHHDVYFSERCCSWGWATWEDRWKNVDWEVKTYKSFMHNWIKRYQFARWGRDLPLMLDYQMACDIDSWAIRWCYQAFVEKKLTVYPKNSLVVNLGTDGSGTHSNEKLTQYETSIENRSDYCCTFEMLGIDNRIRKEFKRHYSNGLYKDFRSHIKGILIRTGLLKL